MSGWRVLVKYCVHPKARLGFLWKQLAEKQQLLAGVEALQPTVIPRQIEGDIVMLYTIAVVLLILWLLGLVTGYTTGAFIHVLLVIAIVMVLVNFISGRKRV
jgi:hypothetical protein